ncbi:polysaccharide pyruvyl transferase WcaK-like protein [Mycetocola sp. BIGb0189]|uniref:polysaccharide pyruvyl transferase family protein n=1 Tax=Mycetocola sp. BIGb0189 TaxID=2940604 RepID=UPI002166F615|nr:polysaccharide pyruvyl transferase family protein [Mycetocola sp. BIGb0189]MCS4275659.1 polysaccharide pyruvyl transferase WcaK-like protein [Mycetocola sp. BIGb0189]
MASPTSRRLVYLGWHGFMNFGDDLLRDSWQAALTDDLSLSAPLSRRDYVTQAPRVAMDRMRTAGAERLVLLGGGTTVGFANWAGHARRAQIAYDADGILIPGAGAAESTDTFALGLQEQGWSDWADLSGVALMGVRGPLTARECAANWIPTPVIGDPALLYPTLVDVAPAQRDDTMIGVALGADPESRFDPHVVAEALRRISMAERIDRVRVFALSATDREGAERFARMVGPLAEVVYYDGDVRDTMRSIAECGLFISERLHGAVAAVSLGVPTVALSYASKCDDFWLSVTGSRSPITVGHDADELLAEIRAVREPAYQAFVAGEVRALQGTLGRAAERINRWLAGQSSTTELLHPAPSGPTI